MLLKRPSISHIWNFIKLKSNRYELDLHLPAEKRLTPLQRSTCSRHEAVNLADSKPNCGYAASGGGTVDCSRHDMKRPNSFGDLQKGER
jgi:hypothetical protein